MRFLTIILSLGIISCISISTGKSDLQFHELDKVAIHKVEARQRADYWDAMQKLNFVFSEQLADSSEQDQFSNALQLMLAGDYQTSSVILEHLVDTSSDSLFIKHSGVLLTGIYLLTFDWDALITLDSKLPNGIDSMNTISLAKAWNTQNDEVIHYPDSPDTVPMEKSISGVPKIKVLVNGIEQTFWIDTGAEFTVLSSDIAKICGVNPLTETASKVGTSTDKKINIWPGMINELKIENLVFKNHPVFIIGKEDLEFRLFKIFKILEIDGILGWNAIQNLKLEIDYSNGLVTFQKPKKDQYEQKNFHYLTQPFVTVSDTSGNPLQFFMDTGADVTSLYDPAYTFFDTSSAEISNAKVGGAGGFQTVKQLKLKDQSLVLGKTRIDFATIEGKSPMGDTEEGFISYDGILGSDIAQDRILILDFQNGWCELRPVTK